MTKCDTIEESVTVLQDGFYTKESYSFMLNTGLKTDIFNDDITFFDIKNNLTAIYHK